QQFSGFKSGSRFIIRDKHTGRSPYSGNQKELQSGNLPQAFFPEEGERVKDGQQSGDRDCNPGGFFQENHAAQDSSHGHKTECPDQTSMPDKPIDAVVNRGSVFGDLVEDSLRIVNEGSSEIKQYQYFRIGFPAQQQVRKPSLRHRTDRNEGIAEYQEIKPPGNQF